MAHRSSKWDVKKTVKLSLVTVLKIVTDCAVEADTHIQTYPELSFSPSVMSSGFFLFHR